MHHRKQKGANHNATGTIGKSIGRRESGMEAMTRLRYLNKKPLCLQYNVPNSAYARKHSPYGGKRKEQSFIVVIIFGLARFVTWAAKNIQQATVDFLVKPAHELFPNEIGNQCFQAGFYSNPIKRRILPKRMMLMSRRNDITRMIQSIDAKYC